MLFEYTEVFNVDGALLGMRNPKESWELSDTSIEVEFNQDGEFYYLGIGEGDLKLARQLVQAGSDHRKFLRQIMVKVNITAPLYWWKEFDTYKVGTTANSTSTMHKLGSRYLYADDFQWDETTQYHLDLINYLNCLIGKYQYYETQLHKKQVWRRLIQDLPSSYLQMRTVTLNFEVLLNMYKARCNHKLKEWSTDFINWADSVPYFEQICL